MPTGSTLGLDTGASVGWELAVGRGADGCGAGGGAQAGTAVRVAVVAIVSAARNITRERLLAVLIDVPWVGRRCVTVGMKVARDFTVNAQS